MRKGIIAGAAVVLGLAAIAGYVYVQRESLLERAIEGYGSDILGADVSVAGVSLSPVDGAGAVRGLRIGHPKGFHDDVANVVAIELTVDPRTIADDVVHVRRIALTGGHFTYENGNAGTNLQALQRNVARYIGETSPQERRASRKFIVDRLVIRGAQLTYVPVSGASQASVALRLPDITLTNIGKQRGGVTAGELTKVVVDAVLSRMASSIGQRALENTVGRLFGR